MFDKMFFNMTKDAPGASSGISNDDTDADSNDQNTAQNNKE